MIIISRNGTIGPYDLPVAMRSVSQSSKVTSALSPYVRPVQGGCESSIDHRALLFLNLSDASVNLVTEPTDYKRASAVT